MLSTSTLHQYCGKLAALGPWVLYKEAGGRAQDAHPAPAARQVDNVLATALQLVRADELFYWVTPRLERGIANVTGAPAARGAARCWAGPPGRLRGGCPVGARLRSAAHWLCAAGNCDVS